MDEQLNAFASAIADSPPRRGGDPIHALEALGRLANAGGRQIGIALRARRIGNDFFVSPLGRIDIQFVMLVRKHAEAAGGGASKSVLEARFRGSNAPTFRLNLIRRTGRRGALSGVPFASEALSGMLESESAWLKRSRRARQHSNLMVDSP